MKPKPQSTADFEAQFLFLDGSQSDNDSEQAVHLKVVADTAEKELRCLLDWREQQEDGSWVSQSGSRLIFTARDAAALRRFLDFVCEEWAR